MDGAEKDNYIARVEDIKIVDDLPEETMTSDDPVRRSSDFATFSKLRIEVKSTNNIIGTAKTPEIRVIV